MKAENGKANTSGANQLHLSSRFTNAVDYARTLHIERRKGSDVPYMAHLLGVASLVMGDAGHTSCRVTEDMVIASILHDAAEDHGGLPRLKDIEHNFGSNVARMVEGLSDSLTEDPHNKQSWEKRKQDYIKKLRGEPADVQLISAADKLHNARTVLEDYPEVGPKIWERFKRGRREQIWYFDELLKVYKASALGRIVGELERVVDEIRRLSARDLIEANHNSQGKNGED